MQTKEAAIVTEEISKVIAALERNSIKGLYAENSAEACA